MSVECDCTDCGGDKFGPCENGMLENEVYMWKKQKSLSNGIEFGFFVLIIFAVGMVAMSFANTQ